jgi:hypothetical protein
MKKTHDETVEVDHVQVLGAGFFLGVGFALAAASVVVHLG